MEDISGGERRRGQRGARRRVGMEDWRWRMEKFQDQKEEQRWNGDASEQRQHSFELKSSHLDQKSRDGGHLLFR